MEQIQFFQVTPAELIDLISESVRTQLESFSNDLQSKTSDSKDEFLTRQETADLFQISLVTVHDWSKTGIIKPYKMGNRTYYKRSELMETLYSSNRSEL